jgi:uncharacterized protein
MIQLFRHLRTMKRAVGKGRLFPREGAVRPASAPLGTREQETMGSPIKRVMNEVGWFRLSQHRLAIDGLEKEIRILHLSDIHLQTETEWLEQLCLQLEGLRPDIVLLTGDIVTRGWTKRALVRLLSAIPCAPLGTYAVMGNWEYWSDARPEKWGKLLSENGVELLVEEWRELEGLVVAGTDDHLAGTSEPEKWLDTMPDKPTLMMTHSPALFPRLCHPTVDLVLAGHAHGGQMRLPGIGPLWVPKGTGSYFSGWYRQDNTHLFVSRGLGWSVAPVRLFCPPELAWIEVVPGAFGSD